MGRAFFYSDQIIPENKRIDRELFEGIKKNSVKIGYIPSCGDTNRKYFNKQKDYYSQYRKCDFVFFDLNDEYDVTLTGELLECDIIHISAGDPISGLTNMKKHGLYDILRNYYNRNGTIVGVSGGAVQMGKNAGLFKLFQGSIDEALQSLGSLQTMGLVDFEFLPHYNRWDSVFKENVKTYSKKAQTVVLACNDGDGIILENSTIRFIGAVKNISNGTVIGPA